MSSERLDIEAAIKALEAQRAVLGDAVVQVSLVALRTKLATLGSATAAQPGPSQTLKQVTILFLDAVGSTRLSRQLDPEEISAVMDTALSRATDMVNARGGKVLQYAGDSMLAVFGADETREDDAERAVRCGLDLLALGKAMAAEVKAAHGHDEFDVRVGIHTGGVLLGGGVDAEGTIRGMPVNIAARMEQTAPSGALRISHDTYALVRGVFEVVEQPPLHVKGVAEPQISYLVQRPKPRAFRLADRSINGAETRMVARQAELQQLQQAFRALGEPPRPQLIVVSGEAGLGKSRLCYEFENWADTQPERFCWFRCRAAPQTREQPFGLVRNLVAWRLEIADDDDADTARRKLQAAVTPLFPADGEAQAHLLGHLIGLDFSDSPHVRGLLDDARQIRDRGFQAAAELVRLISEKEQAPPLILVDDLHWADDGSFDFLHRLLLMYPDLPMLMLCTTRPDLFERIHDGALLSTTHTRIELQTLGTSDSAELATVLLQRLEEVPPALQELVINRANGNPFYMEELVRMLIDDGAIDTSNESWRVVPEKLLAAHLPTTLTGVLQSRLDSLPANEKRALQNASVIGLVFWERALAALDAASVTALPSLVKRGLLLRHSSDGSDSQQEYAFKHQILHQVTYDGLLKRQRRELHAAVAAWLEQTGGDRAGEVLGIAADHYERAGDTQRACALFAQAAEDAAARFACEAMLGFVARALALVDAGDHATRWRLLSLRERHLRKLGDPAGQRADLAALELLAEKLNDDERRISVKLRKSLAARLEGDNQASENLIRAGLNLAGRRLDSVHAAALYRGLADSLIGLGRYEEAKEAAHTGLELAQSGHNAKEESNLLVSLGLIAMEQGDPAIAVAHFERALQMVRERGDRASEAVYLSNLGVVYAGLGDDRRARECLEQGLAATRAIGRRDDEALLLLNLAATAHGQGDETDALSFANAAFDCAVATAQYDLEAFARLVAGDAELGLGHLEPARRAYLESRSRLETLHIRRQRVLEPVSGLARVALAEGNIDEAMQHCEQLLVHLREGGTFDGTQSPLLLRLTIWQALRAAGDPRATRALDDAIADLQAQAQRVVDPEARHAFLERELKAQARRIIDPQARHALLDMVSGRC
jgi:predicted ATPase/class 3 adenylate cyclase